MKWLKKRTKKPKNKEEIEKFIFDKLKAEYGDSVISEKASETIVIDTDASYRGNSDVWISLEYFH